MAVPNITQAPAPVQPTSPPPKAGIGFLAQVLENLNDDLLVAALEQYHPTGRPGYPPRAMLRAYYTKFILNIRYNTQLLERLRGSRRLRELCGFGDQVPSEGVYSRFTTRLKAHVARQERAIIQVVNQLRSYLPDLGATLAIDGSFVPSFANGNRKPDPSDPDADWGFKNSASTKDGKPILDFGYKVHMIADAKHGIPMSFTITPASGSEMTELPKAVRKMRREYPWLKSGYMLADRGFDSEPNHEFLFNRGFTPIIHIRKPTADDGLYNGIYDAKFRPQCLGNIGMDYVRTDPATGQHLFRCSAGGCPLLGKGLVPNCNDEFWADPQDNIRVIGKLARTNPEWKRLYRMRWSVERFFRSAKHSRGLKDHSVMGGEKMRLHINVSVLTWLATALARLQAKDSERMRRMTVRVN